MGLLCVLLIAARLSGAHWHLCQDQASPILSMQGAIDPACDTATVHHDLDIDSAKNVVAKNLGGSSLDFLLLALLVAAWIVPNLRRVVVPSGYLAPAIVIPAFSRYAPSRAPPL